MILVINPVSYTHLDVYKRQDQKGRKKVAIHGGLYSFTTLKNTKIVSVWFKKNLSIYLTVREISATMYQ